MPLARATLLLLTALLGAVQTAARESLTLPDGGGACGAGSCCCEDAGTPTEDAVQPADACPCNEPAPDPGERRLPASAPAPATPQAVAEGGEPAPTQVIAPSPEPKADAEREVPPAPPPRVLLGVRLL